MPLESRQTKNQELSYAVRAVIDADERFRTSSIDINVHDGAVSLTGLVPNPDVRAAVAAVVLRTKCVTSVINHLRVEPFVPRFDSDVTADVVAALTINTAANPAKIDVQTQDGVVYLRGTVANVDERQQVDAIARSVEGVRDVVDDLMIEPTMAHSDRQLADLLRDRLSGILKPDMAERVHVEVRHGVAYLQGDVTDPAIRWALEDLARWTPGIIDVMDNLGANAGSEIRSPQQ